MPATPARRAPGSVKTPQFYSFRGYVKSVGPDKFVAVCLTLNLVTEGLSQKDALNNLSALCTAYMQDAVRDGEVEKWVPRRAPLSFYVEYWTAVVQINFHLAKRQFLTFSEAKPIPLYA